MNLLINFDKHVSIGLLILGVIGLILFVYLIRKEPRRILCGILITISPVFLLRGTMNLLSPNIVNGNGELALGLSDDLLMFLSLIFTVLSFFSGIALCINGIRLILKEGFSLSHVLPIFFGSAGISWFFFYFLPLFLPPSALIIFMIFRNFFLYIPLMLIVILLYSIIYALLPKPKKIDYIIVLGGGLKDGKSVTPLLGGRLNRSIRLYNALFEKPIIIVSGGKGIDEQVSEAFAMKEYLLEKGIPDRNILMEDSSTNTYENLQFSKKLISDSASFSMIVTSNYHALRAAILAKSIGLNAHCIGAKTALYYLPAAFIREYIAIIFSYKSLALLYIVCSIIATII